MVGVGHDALKIGGVSRCLAGELSLELGLNHFELFIEAALLGLFNAK